MALRPPTSNNGTHEEALVSTTVSLGESLSNLRIGVPPNPSVNVSCSHAAGEDYNTPAAALAHDQVGLKPQSISSHNANSAIPSDLTNEEQTKLLGFASTSSMRSLMTDSLFSIRTTTDSCPPSPCSSAHITEPLHCKSWDLIPHPGSNSSRPINASCALRNGGQKINGSPIFYFASSNSSEDGSSHPTSEYGSKESTTFSSRSSVHEFSRFTDEDGEQGRGLRDDLYELLVEDICNVVSNRLTENDLRKLNAPISHHARVLVEHVAHDLEDSKTLSTTPVIYQTFGSSRDGSTSSTPEKSSFYVNFGHGGKRELHYEHNEFDQDDSDDADSGLPMGLDEHQRSRRNSAKEAAMSCPYRKRNPMRFNIRSHASCALSDFPSMTHLRRHIKAFHFKSGERCRRCGAWFESTEDLFDHVTRPTVCTGDTWNRNPEDGIGQADLQNLYDKKVQTWNDVWMILFPELDREIPFQGFDPPVELDEVETRCYGSDSVEDLSEVFQQIALSSPKLSPSELSQRALTGSVGFITSTLQRCRDLHGHTPSTSREAKTQEFLERVQNISFEAPRVQAWASDTSTERSLESPRQVDSGYSQQSFDSGIASLAGSTAWRSLRPVHEAPKQHCDQQNNDLISSYVMAETPSTQASPPDSHFASAEDENSAAEEDLDFQYEQLVENVANQVIKSQWVTPIADDCVSIIKFTHVYLENIRSHHDGLHITQRLPVSLPSPCDGGEYLGSSVDGQETPGLLSANGKRKQDGGHGHRRKRDDSGDNNPNEDGSDDFDDPEDCAGDRKRARTDDCPSLPCPYRKRNPTRFNVREYQQCALNTFTNMTLLKRHIKVFHPLATEGPRCVRCRRCFQTVEDIEEHLRQTNVCEIRSGRDDSQDPEDGISTKKREALTKRNKEEKVDTWDALWKVLFPADPSVPSPQRADPAASQDYEEPVELEEVQEKCYHEQSITGFFQKLPHLTHEDGYLYIVKVFKKIRKTFKHLYCEERRQKDWRFLEEVRKRTSASHAITFSRQSSSVQLLEASPMNDWKRLHGVPPGAWSSSISSVPEMTDTPNTGGSSNNATENTYATTPASSWQQIPDISELPEITRSTSGYFGSSGEDMSYQEQVSLQGGSQKHVFPQFHSPSESCHHQIEVGTYCGECAEELAPFFPPGDLTAYPGETVAGEDGSTMDQDPVI